MLGVMLWNSPNCQALRDAVSFFLAGNSYVLKHAPNVMGFAYLLARCTQRAGLPAGTFSVLNAVPSRISRAIADTGKVCIAGKRTVLERPIAQAITTRELANRSEFGLSCAFWTRNRDLAKSMACQRRPSAYSSTVYPHRIRACR